MSSAKRVYLFDFDGTLVNTMPVIFAAFGGVFREFKGEERTPADIVRLFGPTETGSLEIEFADDPRREAAIERFYEIYENEHDRLTPPVDEIRELLEALRARGARLGVFTGKARRSLDISLAKLLPGMPFEVLVTGDDTRRPKPDPEGLLLAMQRLGVGPGDCLYCGDSSVDVQAGLAAGMEVVQAGWWGTATPPPPGMDAPRFDTVAAFRRHLLK